MNEAAKASLALQPVLIKHAMKALENLSVAASILGEHEIAASLMQITPGDIRSTDISIMKKVLSFVAESTNVGLTSGLLRIATALIDIKSLLQLGNHQFMLDKAFNALSTFSMSAGYLCFVSHAGPPGSDDKKMEDVNQSQLSDLIDSIKTLPPSSRPKPRTEENPCNCGGIQCQMAYLLGGAIVPVDAVIIQQEPPNPPPTPPN